MLITKYQREELNKLFIKLRLMNPYKPSSLDKQVKIEQILAFLEVAHAEIRKMSKKKKLILIDSAAGNCYLSFLVNYYYQNIEPRNIEIHCIDINHDLMQNKKALASEIGFSNMFFYGSDIEEFNKVNKADLVFSLHACDTATDKTLHLGLRLQARAILSVSCCQHTAKIKSEALKAVIRHQSYREKILMMVCDSMRALLIEQQGYKVNIFDFVSTRYTDKNVMLRATRSEGANRGRLEHEYQSICEEFKVKPYLDSLLKGA